MKTILTNLTLACGLGGLFTASVPAQNYSAEDLARRTIERRAVEAAIWGMPLVSVDTMRQAYFRDAGAKYNDILYWSKASDWKFQITTPNASTHYVYFNFNLKDGPVVLDVPPTVGAGLFGSLLNAWQVPLVDVGAEGEDAGKGGKYLLLPPGSKDAVQRDTFRFNWKPSMDTVCCGPFRTALQKLTSPRRSNWRSNFAYIHWRKPPVLPRNATSTWSEKFSTASFRSTSAFTRACRGW
jgi:hypothetical protein